MILQEISSRNSEKPKDESLGKQENEGGEYDDEEDEMELKAAGVDTMASHNFAS